MRAPALSVVLTGADLDVLELALGGALPGGVAIRAEARPAASGGRELLLTDVENTPLALFIPDDAVAPGSPVTGTVQALRPQAFRAGPAFDPRLRRAPSAVRAERAAPAVAVVFRAVPSTADLDAVSERLDGAGDDVLWVAMVSRAAPSAAWPATGPDAVVRAVDAARPDGAVTLVIPDAAAGTVLDPRLDTGHSGLESVLHRYGAREVIDVGAERAAVGSSADTRGAGLDEASVRAAYPPASADELLAALRRARRRPGAMVLLTGLSGSGKSTLARALADRLDETGDHRVSVLDGDDVRRLLSSELGFDRRSRELNVRRIGYVGALIARSGGIAIAAPIAPFARVRAEVRAMVEAEGRFLLVHVSTPLEVCEQRDRKGLYAKARRGEIDEFTGISSPYEPPEDADVVVDTSTTTVHDAVDRILAAVLAMLNGNGGRP